jgi:hypothetical protein
MLKGIFQDETKSIKPDPMKYIKDANRNLISISISGLGVSLHFEQVELAESLQKRYQGFLNEGKNLLSIEIILKGKERSYPLLDIDIQFRADGIRFSSSGFVGILNTKNGTGKLHLSSEHPIEDIDYLLRVAYALLAFQAGGMMLHAAGIVRNSQAYLFTGHSGSGKTTISRLSSGFTVLNDDLVILLPEGDGWRVYATPFWNQTQVKPVAGSAALAAIFCLEQARFNRLDPLPDSRAVAEMVANTPIIPIDPHRSGELLRRYYQIIKSTPTQKLLFLPEASFWHLILEQSS